ncbi:MAG: Kelch repeat-containing protein, partial [Candidatus Rokuibacteriota bacterium]
MRLGGLAGSAVVAILILAGGPLAAPPGRWTQGAPMPEERTEVAVAVLDGRIYVVGGFGGGGALLEYDTAADRWRARAAPPASLHHAGAVAAGGRLYVVGGYTPTWDP